DPGSAPPAAAPGGGAACAARGPPRRRGLAAGNDDAARRIIRREGDGDLVPEHHADAVFPELPPQMGEHLVAVLELDAKISRRQDLDDPPLEFNMLLSAHQRRSPYA